MIGVLRAVVYLLPGLALVALALGLSRAGRAGARVAGAPRWARWFARAAVVLILAGGCGLLLIGVGLARAVWP